MLADTVKAGLRAKEVEIVCGMMWNDTLATKCTESDYNGFLHMSDKVHFSLCDWHTIRTDLEILWKFAVRYSLQIGLSILPFLAIIVPHQESFRLTPNVFQICPLFSFP